MAGATATTPSGPGRRAVAGLIGVGGSAVVVASSFLPWLEGFGESFTGWDLYDLQNDAGENPFMVEEMFQNTFDPFFTGGTTLALGGLLLVLAAAVLAMPERPLPSRLRTPAPLYIVSALVGIATFLVMLNNIRSFVQRPDGFDASLGVGIYLATVGSLAGLWGVLNASARTRRELAGGSAAVPAAPVGLTPAATTTSAPGWYPDPTHRHQNRYWDGQAWTSHVADAGAQSEDTVLTG